MEIDVKKANCTSLEMSAPVCLDAGGSSGEFLIEAYTGTVVDRFWGKLGIEVAGIKAKQKIPIFQGHDQDKIIGWSEKTWADNSFMVSGKFSDATETAKEARALAAEGFPWQASIGVRPTKVISVNEKTSQTVNGVELVGPAEVWTESEVFEVSFVPLGADDKTSIATFSKFIEQAPTGAEHKPIKEKIMEFTLETLAKEAPDLLASIQTDAKDTGYAEGLTAGITQERERVSELMKIEDADDTARTKAITEGLSVDASFRLFFEAEKGKKTEELKKLEDSTPESARQNGKNKDDDEGKTFMSAVDDYQKEKSCTRTEALRAVAQAQPELHKAFKGGK